MPSLSPYLFFDGTCREAMTAYAEILGAEIVAGGRLLIDFLISLPHIILQARLELRVITLPTGRLLS